MRNALMLLALGICCMAPSRGAASDDSILLQLAKADLVIAAELASQPFGMSSEAGVVVYGCDLRNVECLAVAGSGDMETPAASQPSTTPALPTRVSIVRFELTQADRADFMKAGARLILFLQRAPAGNIPGWSTSDVWFGALPYSDELARTIKRLLSRDPHIGDPLADVPFWRLTRPIPELGFRPWAPVPTAGLRLQVYSELVRHPELRAVFSRLHVRASQVDWQPTVSEFEQQRALGCLQLLLCHPNHDVQRAALAALGRLKDRAAVPFLLTYAEYLATAGAGDGHLGDALPSELNRTMTAITGVTYEPRPGEPDAFRKAMATWQRWQAEQVLGK